MAGSLIGFEPGSLSVVAVCVQASFQPEGANSFGQCLMASVAACVFTVYTQTLYSCCGYKEAPMETTVRKARDETINLRASQRQKMLIDRAASALGRNRSDFMLESACKEAESVLLDRRYLAMPSAEFRRFTAMLDKPPAKNARFRKLLKTKAPWEK